MTYEYENDSSGSHWYDDLGCLWVAIAIAIIFGGGSILGAMSHCASERNTTNCVAQCVKLDTEESKLTCLSVCNGRGTITIKKDK